MLTKKTLTIFKDNQRLLSCIFATLIFQITLTFIVFYVLRDTENPLLEKLQAKYPFFDNAFALLASMLGFAFIILTSISIVNNFYVKFFLFSIYSVFEGFLLTLFRSKVSTDTIIFALLATIVIFISMLVLSIFLINIQFNVLQYASYLLFALFILIIIQLTNIFYPLSDFVMNLMRVCIIIVFSIFIIVDTYQILKVKTNLDNDCINGAINFYLNFLNIFSSFSDE